MAVAHDTDIVGVELLRPLMSQIPSLAMPCRVHRSMAEIGCAVVAWAWQVGLVGDERAATRFRHAGFERLACRALPESKAGEVTLFGKWLAWLSFFDDELDEGALGSSAEAVEDAYGGVVAALHRGQARRDAWPIEVAVVDLWHETAVRMSPAWRSRFLDRLSLHRAASRQQAENRRAGCIPTLDDYPLLRRATVGAYMFDLLEPALRVEVPGWLVETRAWTTLIEGTSDVMALSNDIASLAKDRACGDVHNYIIVISHALGMSTLQAAAWVNDRIAERIAQMHAAARALPSEFARLRMAPGPARGASKVACALLGAPRAHLEWLMESGRYEVDSARSIDTADGA